MKLRFFVLKIEVYFPLPLLAFFTALRLIFTACPELFLHPSAALPALIRVPLGRRSAAVLLQGLRQEQATQARLDHCVTRAFQLNRWILSKAPSSLIATPASSAPRT